MSDLIDRDSVINVIVAWTVEDRPDVEMPTDLIDRVKDLPSAQPELNEWCHDCKEYDPEKRYCPRWGQVIKTALEDAQPEQQWIPCSERLPEIGEHYVSEPCIVYCSNGAYGFAELEENIFGQVGWNCERDDEYHEPLGEVLAWMPLPEPYKGEQE